MQERAKKTWLFKAMDEEDARALDGRTEEEEDEDDDGEIPCDICGETVAFSAFAAHADEHAAEAAAAAAAAAAGPPRGAAAWHTNLLLRGATGSVWAFAQQAGERLDSGGIGGGWALNMSIVTAGGPLDLMHELLQRPLQPAPETDEDEDAPPPLMDDEDDPYAEGRRRGLSDGEADAALEPMTAEAIGKLQDDDLCPICLVSLNACPGVVSKTKACGHPFCDGCVRSWLGFGRCCPVCKLELAPPAADNSVSGRLVAFSVRFDDGEYGLYGHDDGDDSEEEEEGGFRDDDDEDDDDDDDRRMLMDRTGEGEDVDGDGVDGDEDVDDVDVDGDDEDDDDEG